MSISTFGATWFIPCTIMQANSALYALSMIKRLPQNKGVLSDFIDRKNSLSGSIFSNIMLRDDKYSKYRGDNLSAYALQFNFTGRYVSDTHNEGLQLNFLMPDIDFSIYSFSPLSAAVFTQAVLEVCGIEKEVEISYNYKGLKNDYRSGCFTVTSEYLDHFNTEHLKPAYIEVEDEFYYSLSLKHECDNLPDIVIVSSKKNRFNTDFISYCSADNTVLVRNLHMYNVKKITYFDYQVISQKAK